MEQSVDAEIAQKVFGWRRLSGLDVARAGGTDPRVQEPHLQGVWFKGENRVACDECGTLPAFSSSFEAAAQVLEEIHRRGWFVDIHSRVRIQGLHAPVVEWLVDVGRPGERFIAAELTNVANTLPAAICAAALRVFV